MELRIDMEPTPLMTPPDHDADYDDYSDIIRDYDTLIIRKVC